MCYNFGENAGMMELVDMRDLGSRAVMRWGSSPHARTKINNPSQYSSMNIWFGLFNFL